MLSISFFQGIAIGVLALAARRQVGSWTHPSCLFSIFWAFMVCLPLLLAPQIDTTAWPVTYLLAAAVAFSAPVFFQNWIKPMAAAHSRQGQTAGFSQPYLTVIVVASQVATLAMTVANLNAQGFPLTAALADPITTACEYLKIRYDGILEPNVFSKGATLLNYFGVVFAGLALGAGRSLPNQLGIIILAILPSLLYMMMYADKGTVFLAGAYLFGSVLVSRISSGYTALITVRTVAAGVLILALIAPVTAVSLLNRSTPGQCSAETRSAEVVAKMSVWSANREKSAKPERLDETVALHGGFGFYARSYAAGHFFAFSDWFESYVFEGGKGYTNPQSKTWGFWTFMALGKHVNPEYRLPPGYFDEYYLADGILMSNIYTMYRGLIYDFGIVGSLVFMVLAGWVSSLAYRQMLTNENAPISQAYFIFLLGFIYTSYIISLLIWNSAWAIPPVICAFLYMWAFIRDRKAARRNATIASNEGARF